MPWIPIAATALGIGASLYGANKQSKDNASAQAQNAALQKEQNNAQWANWLMSRGIAPTTPVDAGVMPTEGNFRAVNTRLPIWATMTRPTATTNQGAPGSPAAPKRPFF